MKKKHINIRSAKMLVCFCAFFMCIPFNIALSEDNETTKVNPEEWLPHKIFPKEKPKQIASKSRGVPKHKPVIKQPRHIYPQSKPWKELASIEELPTVYPKEKPLQKIQEYYVHQIEIKEEKIINEEIKTLKGVSSLIRSKPQFIVGGNSNIEYEDISAIETTNQIPAKKSIWSSLLKPLDWFEKDDEVQEFAYADYSDEEETLDDFENKEGIHRPSMNDFGGAGLMQLPSARFAADGEMNIGSNIVSPYTRNYINIQLFPWLETVFRYTYIDDIKNSPSGNTTFRDRGIDLKLRLREESKYLPAVAVGLRDIGGDRISGSEYVVASKRYNKVDFTAGLGWGNLATRGDFSNPLSVISNRFKDRSNGVFGDSSSDFFHGDNVGVFAGLEYQTPLDGLRFKLEYDSNDYSDEYEQSLSSSSPVNVGLLYEASDWLDVSLGYERGNTIMMTANVHSNFNKGSKKIKKYDPVFPTVPMDQFRNSIMRHQNREQYEHRSETEVNIGKIGDNYFDNKEGKPIYSNKKIDVKDVSTSSVINDLRSIGIIANRLSYDEKNGTLNIYIDEDLSFDLQGYDVKFPEFKHFADFAYRTANKGWQEKEIRNVVFYLSEIGDEYDAGITETLDFDIFDIQYSRTLTGSSIALIKPPTPEWDSVVASVYADKTIEVYKRMMAQDKGKASINNKEYTVLHNVDETSNEDITKVVASQLFGSDEMQEDDLQRMGQKIFLGLAEQGLIGDEFELEDYTTTLYFSNPTYLNPADAMVRAIFVIMSYIPDHVEEISLVLTSNGVALNKVSVIRKDVENLLLAQGSLEEIMINTLIEPASYKERENRDGIGKRVYSMFTFDEDMPKDKTQNEYNYVVNDTIFPVVELSIDPNLRQDIGGNEDFYRWQLWLEGKGLLRLTRNLRLDASVGVNLLNNFEERSSNVSSSSLPKVRSNAPFYIRNSDAWINNLEAHYMTELSDDLYVRGSAGIIEMMFSGVGGEILYRPTDKDWAIGIDANYVVQRDFSGGFGLQDYDVVTGHLSFYKKLDFYNIDAAFRVGQYLAKDVGATLELSRTFNNGIEIGAFVTATDISESDDGENGIDKGMFLHIPLDIITSKSTKKNVSAVFRPLTRDGGQRLRLSKPLYELTDENSKEKIINGWHNLVD